MAGLRELLNNPDALTYWAMQENPALAKQMAENDKRNYALMQAREMAVAMPQMARIQSNGDPQQEWMNNQAGTVEKLFRVGTPQAVALGMEMAKGLQEHMGRNAERTAEQKNNADTGYMAQSPEMMNMVRKQRDPGFVPNLSHQNRMTEIQSTADLRDRSIQKNADTRQSYGGLGRAPLIRDTSQGILAINPDTLEAKPVTFGGQNILPRISDKVKTAIVENNSAIAKIDNALSYVNPESPNYYPDAFGSKNLMGDFLTQRTDPEGVHPRAAVADLGSLKIHDRSGAAVTAKEFPRLKPFIPNDTDTPETVAKKLERFKMEVENIQNGLISSYPGADKLIPDQSQEPQQPQVDTKQKALEWKKANPNGTREQFKQFMRGQ